MSLLEKASLIITPNGYKAGKLYSVIPNTALGDMGVVRATTATRVNSLGLIENVGLNVPRLDYSNGSCPSLLVEPQRTNLFTYSNDFNNGVWNTARLSISNNSLSPDGTLNASGMVEDFTNNSHVIYRFINTNNASIYTISLFVKMGSRRYFKINAVNGGSEVYYDLQNKTTTGGGSIVDFDNGWLKLIYTYTTNSINGEIYFEPSIDGITSNYLGNGSTAVYIYGAQLEQGAYPTSYIPTVASTVTRNADVISKNNIYTNGLITSAGGTWFVELNNNFVLTRDGAGTFQIGDALGNNFAIKSIGTLRLAIIKNISNVQTVLYITLTDIVKIAVDWNGTTADVFVNGVKVVTATSFTTTNMNSLTTSVADVPRYIKSTMLFPTPLTDLECQQLTTLYYSSYSEMALNLNYIIQ